MLGIGLENLQDNSIFHAASLAGVVEVKNVDVRSADEIAKILNDFHPDFIFHLAAQAIVGESYKDPYVTFETNVMGTIALLESIKNFGRPCIGVFITSDKSYRNDEQIWGYRETDYLGGEDPYSASKACADIAIASYTQSFFRDSDIKIAATRAGNVIGGGDRSADRLVPDCISHLCEDGEIVIRNPQSTRPWQHVLEPLSGYLHLGSSLSVPGSNFCSAWNFGPKPSNSRTVLEVAEEIVKNWGSGTVSLTGEKRFLESNLLQLDCTKARELIGWEPILDFDESIRMTVDWYLMGQNTPMGGMYDFSIEQIQGYERAALARGARWIS